MQRYFDSVQDASGNAVKNASIAVYNSQGALATLYSDNGVTPLANPLTTDGTGQYAFYAANGTYSTVTSAAGLVAKTEPGIVLFDPLDDGWVSTDEYGGNTATAAAAGLAKTVKTGAFLQFTRPLRYDDFAGTYTERNAVVNMQRNVSVTPTGIWPTIFSLAAGQGDNATQIGISGGYFQARDSGAVNSGNKGVLYGLQLSIVPSIARNNVPFDDATGLVVRNDTAVPGSKATDAVYVGNNPGMFSGDSMEWGSSYTTDANSTYKAYLNGAYMQGVVVPGNMTSPNGTGLAFSATSQIQSTVTTEANMFFSRPNGTQAAAFTLPSLNHFVARFGSIGSGSTVTTQAGFRVDSTCVGAGSNYGFWGGLNTGGNNWNFYASGTAPNFMQSELRMGFAAGVPTSGANPALGTSLFTTQSTGSHQLWSARYSADNGGVSRVVLKSRGASQGAHAVVANGDLFARDMFYGSDGTNWIVGAELRVAVDGTPGTNSMPGSFDFQTTPAGAAAAVSRIKISNAGNVILNNSGAALAPAGTSGYTYLPTVTNTPTGVPAVLPTGAAPMCIDTTNNKLWAYVNGAWKSCALI